jgi:ribosomal protein L22
MNTQAYALRKACRDKQYVPTVTQAYKLARLARSNVIIRKHEPSVVSSFKNLKTSRKKVQPFCSWVRGMTLKEAIMQTTFHKRKAAHLLSALLRKAEHNAAEALQMDRDRLIVTDCWVGRGQSRKELWIRAKGRFDVRVRPSAHMWVRVKEATSEEISTIQRWQELKKIGKEDYNYLKHQELFAEVTQDEKKSEVLSQMEDWKAREEWQESLDDKENKVEQLLQEVAKDSNKEP